MQSPAGREVRRRVRTPWHDAVVAALALNVAGCATMLVPGRAPPAENIVISDPVPAASSGEATPRSITEPGDMIDEAAPSEFLDVMSHMVANDGRIVRPVLELAPAWSVGGCGRGLVAGPIDLREEVGVYRPIGLPATWGRVLIGLTGTPDGLEPGLFEAGCGGNWWQAARVSADARMAPGLTGRDTSLLFTRSSRALPGASVESAVATIGRLLFPSHDRAPAPAGAAEPRTAHSRPSTGTTVDRTASPEPAAPVAPAAAPSRGERNDRGAARPRGSR
jgi:hypothetical protein